MQIAKPDFLIEIFLEESWKHIDKIDTFINRKAALPTPTFFTKEEIDEMFRTLHSMKGTAIMMGYVAIAETAHAAEDLFAYLQEEDNPNPKDLIAIIRLLRMVSSYIKRELRRIETNEDTTDYGWAIVKQIKNFLEHVENDGEPENTGEEICYTRVGRKKIPFVDFSTLLLRGERLIAVMGREMQKHVVMEICGIETEVPREIFDKISMAVLQMIKNSIDHGIESVDERITLGKNPVGKIIIEIKKNPQRILVVFRDDGRGLDKCKILKEARERGVLIKNEDEYSGNEIYRLLLRTGFTTKNRVTMFSGRGVGLDVVNASIASLGGTIQIESFEHMGTTFFMEIPIS